MFGIGFSELIVILIAALILIGPEKLFSAAVSAGRYVRAVKAVINDIGNDISGVSQNEITPIIKKHMKKMNEDPAGSRGSQNKEEE